MKCRFLLLALGMALIVSCSKDQDLTPDVKTGSLIIRSGFDTKFVFKSMLKSGSQENLPDPNDFKLSILSDGGTVIKSFDHLSGAPESIELAIGTYTVKTFSEEFAHPRFNAPVYGAEKEISIVANKNSSASLNCGQTNVGIKFNWSDNFKKAYSYYTAKVCEGDVCLDYTNHKADIGYFQKGDVVVKITAGKSANDAETYTQMFTLEPGDLIITPKVFGGDNDSDSNDNKNTGNEDFINRVEIPKLKRNSDDLFITHTTKYNGKQVLNYSMEYVKPERHARWVAFTYYHETAAINTTRSDAFDDDPQVPETCRAVRSDYTYPPYDRGHLVASSDRVYSREANEQTFYYSNMSPQYSNFNRNVWTKFEEKVRNWGRSDSFRDTLYVVKGGTIDNGKIIEYTRPNNIVPVPKYYFMAIVKYKDHKYQGIAFWIEHRKDYTASNFSVENYSISIDKLEALTGIDFFPNLPDSIEDKVEAGVDKSLWTGL